MNAFRRQTIVLLLAVGALGACGFDEKSPVRPADGGAAGNSSTGQAGSGQGAAGTGTGAAGTGAAGAGVAGTGAAGTGAAGTGVTMDAGADAPGMDAPGTGAAGTGAAGTGAAGTGVPMMPCGVVISSEAGFDDLPAGPNEKLRVRGVVTGPSPPIAPAWMWTVTLNSTGERVPTTPDPQDPSAIEFPIARADRYLISANVRLMPYCGGVETATTTFTPTVPFFVRITPPRERDDLAPHEETIKIRVGVPMPRTFYFERAARVSIDPMRPAAPTRPTSEAIASYVRITSRGHSSSREGDTTIRAFPTTLVDDPSWLYDVLIVPLDVGIPPLFVPGMTAASLVAQPLVVAPGLSLTGTLGIEGGAPVKGATVLMRDGPLPSTLGTSDATGAFALRARFGLFSAVILPANGELPEVRIDDGGRIFVPFETDMTVRLDFNWRADLGARTLSAHFSGSDGSPAAGIDVRVDSAAGALPNVGSLHVTSGGNGGQTVASPGAVHRTAKTDDKGDVTFPRLPRASYHLMGVPPVASGDGVTVMLVDLTAAAPASTSVTMSLARKVTVTGRLANAPAGTRIIVLDDHPVPIVGHDFAPAVVGAGGAYTLALDPHHAYHLLADPPAGRGVSRVPLGLVETDATPVSQGVRVLPRMFTLTGRVQTTDGVPNVAGAKVQIFCIGAGPDCVAPSELPGRDPLPLIESLTDGQGGFTLWVPSPSLSACIPGDDQTCNDDPATSLVKGHCSETGTCTCSVGSNRNPDTGRCSP